MTDYLDPKEEALKYLSNISDTLFDPASAEIQAAESAPFQRTVVGMYGAKAPGHVTTASTTKSVLVYYDPEATLANGQNTVQVVERDASNTASAITTIDVGLPSTTYSSAGVLSSTLSVKNTGSDNNRTGTITSGVLLVPDTGIYNSSTAQILNQVYGDRQNDTITSAANDEVLVTRLLGAAAYPGASLQRMKDGAVSHDVSIDHSISGYTVAGGATAGFAKTVEENFISGITKATASTIFTTNQAGISPYRTTSDVFGVQGKSAAELAAASATHNIWYDSRTAKDSNGKNLVFGSDNYRVSISGSLQMRVNDNIADELDDGVTFVAGGFSADGKLCTQLGIQDNNSSLRSATGHNTFGTFAMNLELASPSIPIAYVLIAAIDLDVNSNTSYSGAAAVAEINRFDGGLVNVSAVSETSTLSERFVHFSCIDGLKGNDAISVLANCVIAGLLNTTQRQTSNVVNRPKMISNDCLATYIEFLDGQMRHAMLEQEHKLMQAFVQKELSTMDGITGQTGAESVLAAAGGIFGRFGKKLKKVGKSLRKGKSVLSAIRDVAEVGSMMGVPGAGALSKVAGTGAGMMGQASDRERQMSALMGN